MTGVIAVVSDRLDDTGQLHRDGHRGGAVKPHLDVVQFDRLEAC